MGLFKKLFDFYIFSNTHVALGAFCFVKVTLLPYGLVELNTPFFVFFSTILSYNFIRFLNVPKVKNWFSDWYVDQKKYLILLSAMSMLGCFYFLFKLNWNAVFVLIPFVLITSFYGMNISNKSLSLRKIPRLKIFLIAFCYAGVTVLFPLVQNGVEIGLSMVVLFVQRFLFVLLITLPFDIRDVEFDADELKTLPQYLGIRKSKIIGFVLMLFILLLEWFFIDKGPYQLVILLLVLLISTTFLYFSRVEQSKYYSSFWVEAMPIVWYLLLMI